MRQQAVGQDLRSGRRASMRNRSSMENWLRSSSVVAHRSSLVSLVAEQRARRARRCACSPSAQHAGQVALQALVDGGRRRAQLAPA